MPLDRISKGRQKRGRVCRFVLLRPTPPIKKGASRLSKRLQNQIRMGSDYFIIILAFGAFFAGFFAFFAISRVLLKFSARARSAYRVQPRLVPLVYERA